MSAKEVLEEISKKQGWDTHSEIDLLLRYIDNQQSMEAFEDFLKTTADVENAEAVLASLKSPHIEVEVCDITVVRRNVTIHSLCTCGADLTAPGAIKVWEYQDQSRYANIAEGALDWYDSLPEGGESFMQVSFACNSCEKVLAEGEEK